ncbi:Uncharacterised protein [Mycobacterium tuberculosis]|uniref:Uncharacterized protein n=1 Tax=Mycobacterium tuberculosis TaxID=1773 RepID=A0A655CSF6_MYCTX|nr:Uncharacterised protein [Mycobacterium tuberculosis]CFS18486.1 Uncharacterised protein [Mycobacterium tuberculosis]CKS06937.1 Uncharacterised protein [Mycobacterium tuberculosis]CKT77942.1 Uncharacterised protein [Mycobacterium tuberculosis]CKX54424.1 Uncharacterised protein [Mycobacterium tuberculosis]
MNPSAVARAPRNIIQYFCMSLHGIAAAQLCCPRSAATAVAWPTRPVALVVCGGGANGVKTVAGAAALA